MKVLIANDGFHAHYYERVAWANAFNASGIQCQIYDCKRAPAFAVFDSFEPDIFIGQLYNLDRATLKCIQARPHLKVALRAGEWRDERTSFMSGNPHILEVTNDEISVLRTLRETTGKPDLIYTHYLQPDIELSHARFKNDFDIKLVGVPMSADIHTYGSPQFRPELECDIAFVGGYWPYKAQVFDIFLLPLLSDFNYNVKIFGNQVWPYTNQYCGMIEDNMVKDLFASAKICPNLSEPHAQQYGIDMNERAFKVLAAGGFCIMDNVRAAKDTFGEGVVFADSPAHFQELVSYYLTRPEERGRISRIGRNIVLKSHTNYHRAALFLKELGEPQAEKQVLDALNNCFQ